MGTFGLYRFTITTMAASFARSLRLAEPTVCRQCAIRPTQRTFASLQNPKREIRSRPAVQQGLSAQRLAGKPSFACSRGYKTVQEAKKGIGKPLVGGPFHLTDHNGKEFTEQDLKGKYSLVYFGFTHCPDICPEELDKMAGMIDRVKAKHGDVLLPVFISCDPARDTPEVIRRYLAEFHPDMLGMTGTWQEVKDVCKAYRVYFSTPPDVKPGQDYLVDHSIYFYLMD